MTGHSPPHDPRAPAAPPRRRGRAKGAGFGDRLLAESVRALEHDGARPIDDPRADAKAAAVEGDLEARIIARAAALEAAPRLEEVLRRARQAILLIIIGGSVAAAIAGASAARASLATEDDTVNVFWALGGLLGIQTVLLVAWLALMIKGGAGALAAASLGGGVLAIGRRLAARWHKGEIGAAAVEGLAGVMGRGAIGRWTLSAISHGLWVVFNTTCLLLVILMLSARHYRFVWETTILSADAYHAITAVAGWLPSKLGFAVPTVDQVAVSDGSLPPSTSTVAREATRHAWSGFLIGSLTAYGFAPRILLLGLCLSGRRRARLRYRLDTGRPGFRRLQPLLMPPSRTMGVVDAEVPGEVDDAEIEEPGAAAPVDKVGPRGGPPAILGLEIEPPATSWPPPVGAVRWYDLGFVDGRADRKRVIHELAEMEAYPAMLVVVCGLTSTPDRGLGAYLGELNRTVAVPMGLVLTGGQTLRRRGNGELVTARVADWRALAERAGVASQRILELDLDHLTDTSALGLAGLLGVDGGAPAARRVELAFELILQRTARWDGAPDPRAQARLHEAIAGIYRNEIQSSRGLFRLPPLDDLKSNLGAPLAAGAERIVGLLPARLKSHSRWAVSGAVAGALGCVAAATLLFPAAITALPVWSAVGAAVATVAGAGGGKKKAGSTTEAKPDHEALASRGDAVRSATLFALVLELQGRPEPHITRILDEVLVEDEGAEEDLAATMTRHWLDGVRHRLDLALARERRS